MSSKPSSQALQSPKRRAKKVLSPKSFRGPGWIVKITVVTAAVLSGLRAHVEFGHPGP